MSKNAVTKEVSESPAKDAKNLANSIHFIFQGKGGIGKSFVASLLAQWCADQGGAALKCYDTDQENTTLAHYKALNVSHIPVMRSDYVIDPKKFDGLMEQLLTTDGVVSVIDNGSNTFAPLCAYLVENQVLDFLRENGKRVFIHTVVGGGDNLPDTAKGFTDLARGLDAPMVLWLNEHFGELKSKDGSDFLTGREIQEFQDKLCGVVLLEARNRDTYGADILRMNTMRLTIREVMESPEFTIMEKQRIRVVQKAVFEQLDKAEF